MKKIFFSLLLCSSSFVFVACRSASNSNGSITRPLSLEDLVLTTPAGDDFQFSRSFSSGVAEDSGDIETGSFSYTFGGTNLQLYPSLSGDNSDVQFPDSINLASYEYLAINDSSGIITLNGVGVNDLNVTGGFNANNASFTFFFNNDSSFIVSNQVIIDITFESSGATITGVTSTWAVANSITPNVDTVVIPTTLTSSTGATVQTGHNPELDLDAPSDLVPSTFTGLVFVLTDDDGTEPEVRLQFNADAGFVTVDNVDETGLVLQRVANSPTITSGISYVAERVEQTSNVQLLLDGGNNAQDGSYILTFEGTDSGTVTQTNGSGNLLQGTFGVFSDGL